MQKMQKMIACISVLIAASVGAASPPDATPARGPLRVHPDNPRYFTDGSGRAVYLTGSHTWNNLQDPDSAVSPPFDYDAFLDFLQRYDHNFFRIWSRMGTGGGPHVPEPTIYSRTGPGKTKDGGPKYDLNRFNEAYFQRLRARVKAASDRGIYVAVMFFAGDNVEYRGGNPNWPLHPYHRDNNINGINGDPNGDGQGLECYQLEIPAITLLQEKYVKKVVDTLGDLDNVLWEVGNELPGSLEFAYHITRLVKEYESSSKLKKHPVGISTFADAKPPMRAFVDGPADWITPDASSGDYMYDPPAADGKKVIVSDTDHLWGVGGDRDWVWKTFTRGLNPIYMDALDADATRERARRAMGHTRRFAERMNLAAMTPQNGLASTGYCLASPGKEYLIYQPKSGDAFSVELKVGTYRYEWFNPAKGVAAGSGRITSAGGQQQVKPPFKGDAVLYLKAANVPEQHDYLMKEEPTMQTMKQMDARAPTNKESTSAPAKASSLVYEVTSSPVPYSQVVVAPDAGQDISLILDREEYDPLDVTGVAVIRFQPGAKHLNDLRVRLQLHNSQGQPVLTEELSDLRGEHLDVTLALDRVPLGNYTLHALLTDSAGAPYAEATAPLRKLVKRKQLHEPDRQQVGLRVWPAEGAMESDWPMMTGVPFPQGVLFNQNQVRLLDEKGNEMPCQTSVRSIWNRHGSIRWLGLDFLGCLSTSGAKYTLEFGKQVQRAAMKGMAVVEDDDAIRVDTGPLQFIVRKLGFNLLDEVRLNGNLISRQDAQAGLELTDHEGNIYRASNDPNVSVVVEETGPVRTTIRATGWYVKDGTSGELLSPFLPTDRLCMHDTRITAYAGKPYVTVQHALVVTFDSHKVRLRHIGVSQRVEDASAGAFGLDGKAVAALDPARQSVRLYQPASVDGQVESGEPDGPDFQTIAKGGRGDGWGTLSGPNGSLTMCVTDFWQLYPKELELVGDRLSLNIWPRYGRTYTGVNPLDLSEIYKLWWCHTGRELSFTMPNDVFETLMKDPVYQNPECSGDSGRVANAQGIAIENNFLLVFGKTASQEKAARLNATYQYAPHAWADPQWVCDSWVFGPMTPKDTERFPTAERHLAHAVDVRDAAQEYARDYGQLNYQDTHSDNSHFSEGRWGLNRVWNDDHGVPRIPWLLYVRSAEPKYLQFGRRLSRHVMNVDITHYVTPDYDLFADMTHPRPTMLPHKMGAHFHCKGFVHWGGDSGVAAHYVTAAYDQLFWNYYVTGNRRALDVAMEWVESINKIRPRPHEGREGIGTAGELVEAYQATLDAGLLELMDAFAKRAGSVAFGEQHAANWGPFINRYLAFTGNENFRRRLLEWPPDDWYGDTPKPNIRALRYYETGDASHLREILPQMFFISLRYSTEPPQISARSYLYSWFILAFRVTFWQPYLRALVDEGIPLFVDSQEEQPFPEGGRIVEKKADDGKTQSVCVIAAGTEAQFPDSQVWYFRTAPEQKVLELQVPAVSERGIHIRTSDGSRIIAHMGSDGYLVGRAEGTLKAAVQPSTLYYLASGTLKSPNRITPVGYPLILARTAEEWFEPED